jgi:sortase A
MRKKLSTIILMVILLLGLSLLLYPAVSNYINSMLQNKEISNYVEDVAQMSDDEYEEVLKEAQEYNKWLAQRGGDLELTDEERERYNETLNILGNGLMGYIEIPTIDCTLPIYHGTDETVLQSGAGHIEGSSLPIGGESTHCVILAHRGLPSAKLFSSLDKLTVGDTFTLNTLDEILTYEVDQIKIVLPEEVDDLRIVEGKDYCTLVTCTPYGVNTHRLLVRGHRVEDTEEAEAIRVTADASQFDTIVVAPFAALPIIVVMMIILFTGDSKQRKHKEIEDLIGKEEEESDRKT